MTRMTGANDLDMQDYEAQALRRQSLTAFESRFVLALAAASLVAFCVLIGPLLVRDVGGTCARLQVARALGMTPRQRVAAAAGTSRPRRSRRGTSLGGVGRADLGLLPRRLGRGLRAHPGDASRLAGAGCRLGRSRRSCWRAAWGRPHGPNGRQPGSCRLPVPHRWSRRLAGLALLHRSSSAPGRLWRRPGPVRGTGPAGSPRDDGRGRRHRDGVRVRQRCQRSRW